MFVNSLSVDYFRTGSRETVIQLTKIIFVLVLTTTVTTQQSTTTTEPTTITTQQPTTTTEPTTITTQQPTMETIPQETIYMCTYLVSYHVLPSESCCDGDPSLRNLTTHQLKQAITELRNALLINMTELSSYKRKLTSAADERTSSRAMGFISIILLATLLVFLILGDATILVRHLNMFLKNVRIV